MPSAKKPIDQKKKRPGHRSEESSGRTKIKGASEPPSRPGPKKRGRERGNPGARKSRSR